jgi:hypothetical protein
MQLRTIILFVTLCGCVFQLQAQSKEAFDPPTGKWEVATDLLWLIDKNYYPFSVFVRQHGEKGAWRCRVGGSFKRQKDFLASPQLKVTHEYLLILGREWHLQEPNRRIVPYVGLDAPVSYSVVRERTDIRTSGQTFINNNFTTNISIGAAGLLGLRYHLSTHLSVSAEASFHLNYQRRKWFSRHNINPSKVASDFQWVGFQLIPLQMLSLSYHF